MHTTPEPQTGPQNLEKFSPLLPSTTHKPQEWLIRKTQYHLAVTALLFSLSLGVRKRLSRISELWSCKLQWLIGQSWKENKYTSLFLILTNTSSRKDQLLSAVP